LEGKGIRVVWKVIECVSGREERRVERERRVESSKLKVES
jgi:hypothetical protein